MEKIAGQIISKTTNVAYSVKWDSSEQTAWVERKGMWQMVCTNVRSSEGAVIGAQIFIDSQPDLF
jgi:hypothetical protein